MSACHDAAKFSRIRRAKRSRLHCGVHFSDDRAGPFDEQRVAVGTLRLQQMLNGKR